MWGYLIHSYSTKSNHKASNTTANNNTHHNTVQNLQHLLSLLSWVWGVATIAVAIMTSAQATTMATTRATSTSASYYYWYLQIVTRSMNGIALGSILPVSQALIAKYSPPA